MYNTIRLAKAGYYGGSPEAILNAPVDIVMHLIHYEQFEIDIEYACAGVEE